MMRYETHYIDRNMQKGLPYTDYYAQKSCTAERAVYSVGTETTRFISKPLFPAIPSSPAAFLGASRKSKIQAAVKTIQNK